MGVRFLYFAQTGRIYNQIVNSQVIFNNVHIELVYSNLQKSRTLVSSYHFAPKGLTSNKNLLTPNNA